MPVFVYWVMGILIIIIICMYQIIQGKNETIEQNRRAFNNREKEEEARVKDGITALHSALVAKYGEDYLYAISGASKGDYIGEDMYPHSLEALTIAFADQYTYYLGGHWQGSDVKYHHRGCRFARSSYPVNVMYLQERRRYRPCMLCIRSLPDTSWVERYKKHHNFMKKYIDEKPPALKQMTSYKIPVPGDPGVKVNYRGRT